jgi:4-diphosphocytidyl-2C-methyl-D-erythritol kinase
VYDAFDDRSGEVGYQDRHAELLARLNDVSSVKDFAHWPKNDLARSVHADELEGLGAVRADVSGAGPAVYGVFEEEEGARRAEAAFEGRGRVWVTFPAWYG